MVVRERGRVQAALLEANHLTAQVLVVKLHFQIKAMHHTTIQAIHAVSGSQQNAVKILNLYQ